MNTILRKKGMQRGLVKTVILIIIALLVLSYFGFNIRAIVNSPAGHDNFTYTQEVIYNVWNNYLKKPFNYLWNDIFLNLIWNPAVENLKKIKDGEEHDLQSRAPTLPQPRQVPD